MKNNFIYLTAVTFLICSLSGCNTSKPKISSNLVSSDQGCPPSTSPGPVYPSSDSGEVQLVREEYRNPCTIRKQDGTPYFVTIADPDVLKGNDGYFYMYPTNAECEVGEKGITFDRGPIFRSSNMVDWKWVGSVFSDNPQEGLWGHKEAGVWAPSIIKIGDTYNYYYSLSAWGDPNPGIGVATAPNPWGPWTHYGKLLDSVTTGVMNSIDPQVILEDGTPYIVWGSFYGIACTRLTDDGLELFYGELVKDNLNWIIKRNSELMDIDSNFEGSYIIKRGEYYYYFGSQGTCCNGSTSTYRVKVGKSKKLFGPYLGSDGEDMIHGTFGDLVIGPSDEVAGVGHNAVIQDYAGDYWLVYHGFDIHGDHSEERKLYIDKLLWNEETLMPYVEGKQASTVNRQGPLTIKKGNVL